MNDTVVALAAAYGVGSISIIRVSGSRTLELGLGPSHKDELNPRYAYFVKLFNNESVFINEVIMVYFRAPFSFTGRDVVEFRIHGGSSVSEILLDELLKDDVRLAEAGEFSKRTCLSGKVSALKTLNIQDLVGAKSVKSAKIIARNMQGALANLIKKIRLDLVKSLAFVKTSIDYADDDLSSDLVGQIRMMRKENARILEEIYTLSRSKKALLEGFKITTIGKPSVGKSSLLDALLTYERAIVSPLAGTTRDFIEESLKIGTHLVKTMDIADIGESEEELEKIGIELSKKGLNEADIILALFNSSGEFDGENKEILNLLKNSEKKVFYLLDKCDLEPQFESLNEIDLIKISTKEDIMPLKKALESYLDSLDSEDFLVSSLGFINACERASEAIRRAKTFLDGRVLELFTFELNVVIGELAKSTKDFKRKETLDEMFGNFCLGK